MSNRILTEEFSEPLSNAKSATIEIDTRQGNLVVDPIVVGEQLLAAGTLEYEEKRGLPARTLSVSKELARLAIRGAGGSRAGLRLPWEVCNAATDWNIHLNPLVSLEIDAVSGGGNIKLDLTAMRVTRVSAASGGGNLELLLPERIEDVNVIAKSGAGNVSLQLPRGIAARIYARTGVGKVIIDERFDKIDEHTFQTRDYEGAAHKAELSAESGAGNVSLVCY